MKSSLRIAAILIAGLMSYSAQAMEEGNNGKPGLMNLSSGGLELVQKDITDVAWDESQKVSSLIIKECQNIESLPNHILTKLSFLSLEKIDVSKISWNFFKGSKLAFKNCENLQAVPLINLEKLSYLSIADGNLLDLPENFQDFFTSYSQWGQDRPIINLACPKLKTLPKGEVKKLELLYSPQLWKSIKQMTIQNESYLAMVNSYVLGTNCITVYGIHIDTDAEWFDFEEGLANLTQKQPIDSAIIQITSKGDKLEQYWVKYPTLQGFYKIVDLKQDRVTIPGSYVYNLELRHLHWPVFIKPFLGWIDTINSNRKRLLNQPTNQELSMPPIETSFNAADISPGLERITNPHSKIGMGYSEISLWMKATSVLLALCSFMTYRLWKKNVLVEKVGSGNLKKRGSSDLKIA